MYRIKNNIALYGALAGSAALLFLAGCGGDSSTTAPAMGSGPTGGSTSGSDRTTGGPGGPGPGMMGPGGPGGPGSGMMGPGGPGGPGSGMMGSGGPGIMGGAGPGAAPAQAASAPPPKDITRPSSRPDPFKPWWDSKPKPPPVLSFVAPLRLAIYDSAKPENEPNIEVQEVPSRRVAGILTGNGAYAVFDTGDVVTPGSTYDGYTVASINSKSVTLKKKVGTRTYVQVVSLSDAGGFAMPGSGPTGGGMTGAGSGGMLGGRRGRPGGIPGMGRGGGMGVE